MLPYPYIQAVSLVVFVASAYWLFRKHAPRQHQLRLFLAVTTPTAIIRSSNMQIQALVGTSKSFDVIALGRTGAKLKEAVAFTLSNPDVADLVFSEDAMTLTVTFKAVGTSDLLEAATSVPGVSTTHTITVTDVVVSVDLAEIPQDPTTAPVTDPSTPAADPAA
jgi:hypothetical protein